MAFYGAYLLFAGLGSLVSIACLVPSLLFRGVRVRAFGQGLIQRLFAFFIRYVRACGLVDVDATALAPLCDVRGTIVVANHPSLIDAVVVVSRLPRAFCLMKGSLSRSIVLAGTSRLAGYVDNQTGLGLVKLCAQRLKEGGNLVIFPEGTRTVGKELHPFKMGFALIAVQTGSPVQTVHITVDGPFLGKHWPLLKMPDRRVRFLLEPGKRFEPAPGMDVKTFGGLVEDYFRKSLSPVAAMPAALLLKKT